MTRGVHMGQWHVGFTWVNDMWGQWYISNFWIFQGYDPIIPKIVLVKYFEKSLLAIENGRHEMRCWPFETISLHPNKMSLHSIGIERQKTKQNWTGSDRLMPLCCDPTTVWSPATCDHPHSLFFVSSSKREYFCLLLKILSFTLSCFALVIF
jgi:hypothetical protein